MQMRTEKMFCVSYYEGDLDILKYSNDNFIVYFKGDRNKLAYENFQDSRKEWIENTGYNISTYLKYIEDRYDNLPDITVFCKNNVYPRHLSEKTFARLCKQNIFTPLVENDRYELSYPITLNTSTGDYLEVNDSWYARGREGRYFNDFDSFFSFLFPAACHPTYANFTPGANFVVPKANILNRSRAFYRNLSLLMEYESHSLESFFVERALGSIFCSSLQVNTKMESDFDTKSLRALIQKNKQAKKLKRYSIAHFKKKLGYLLLKKINQLIGKTL